MTTTRARIGFDAFARARVPASDARAFFPASDARALALARASSSWAPGSSFRVRPPRSLEATDEVAGGGRSPPVGARPVRCRYRVAPSQEPWRAATEGGSQFRRVLRETVGFESVGFFVAPRLFSAAVPEKNALPVSAPLTPQVNR